MSKIIQRPDRRPVSFHGVITASPEMKALLSTVERVARSEVTVLVRGETGTGKELIARALHDLSPRASRPFSAINCATLSAELLASELFGHVRGAFTGAVRDHKGLFEMADGGTVFLDEIAELPLELQARLLRVLQERTFHPVGGTAPVTVDVRLVSATNKGLRTLVAEGRFREDLMYRVRVVPLFLPRLAERDGDVEVLLWHFIDEFNARYASLRTIESVDSQALDLMLDYAWPGNVRELRNVVEHAFAIGDGPVLRTSDLTPELRGEPPPDADESALSPSQGEKARVMEALRRAGGRKSKAADALGISRSTLWRKMREYRLE